MKWIDKLTRIPLPFWAVWLAPAILLGSALVKGEVLFWGTSSLQFVPWWMEAWEQIRAGSIPLWNHYNGMGAPLAANYQSAFFYPPNWLLLVFAAIGKGAGIAWGYTFLAMLHLIWGGVGMVVLMRRFGAGELAQAVAGLAFGMSGYLIGRLEFFSMVWVAAWLPWMIRYADEIASPVRSEEILQTGTHFPLKLSLVLTAQLLAGHAQLAWYSLLLTGIWVLVGALRKGVRTIPRAIFRLGLAGLVAGGLAAVQLLPTVEYLTQSQRSNKVDTDFAMTYSYWPWRLVTLFAPDFFGNPGRGDFWGYASYWEDHAYIGLPALLLAFSTLPTLIDRRKDKRVPWSQSWLIFLLWGMLILAFLLALGKNTPIFLFLFDHIPTFNMFQAPARYLIWATFGLAMLAGLGAELWQCPKGKGLYWLRLGTAGMFAVTLGAGIAWLTMGDVRLTFIRATALAGGWALGTGIFTLLLPLAEKKNAQRIWNTAVVGWLMADLLVAGWVLNPTVSADFYASTPSSVRKLSADLEGGRVYMSDLELNTVKFQRFFRLKDFRPVEAWQNVRETVLPNLNLADRVASANNFDPLLPGRYVEWIGVLDVLDSHVWEQWLQWMDVRVIEKIDISQPAGVDFRPVKDGKSVWWFSCAEVVPDSETALATLRSGGGLDRLIIEEKVTGWEQPCQRDSSEIVPLSKKSNKLKLSIDTDDPGWLMVSQTWYPGWKAYVDGIPVDVLRAHYLFMAVPVSAGHHTVEFAYRPNTFLFGLLLSILVGIGLLTWRFEIIKHVSNRYRKPR